MNQRAPPLISRGHVRIATRRMTLVVRRSRETCLNGPERRLVEPSEERLDPPVPPELLPRPEGHVRRRRRRRTLAKKRDMKQQQ